MAIERAKEREGGSQKTAEHKRRRERESEGKKKKN